jgi:hypothetical protein
VPRVFLSRFVLLEAAFRFESDVRGSLVVRKVIRLTAGIGGFSNSSSEPWRLVWRSVPNRKGTVKRGTVSFPT